MFEAIFAGIIIITFLLIIGRVYFITTQPENPSIKAYEILKGLDDQGMLKEYTVSLDYDGLNSQISSPFNHSIEICNKYDSCVGERPDASNIWIGGYIISGNNTYEPYHVKLYLW